MRRYAILLALMLGGCGFEPLYAERSAPELGPGLAGIAVAPIPDRIGQLVHNRLTASLNRDGSSGDRHRLEVELLEATEGFGFRSDEAITRERVRLIAHYRLIDNQSGEVVVDETTRADTALDVVQSDFATYSAEQSASERNADLVTRAIVAQLALYFRAQSAATP